MFEELFAAIDRHSSSEKPLIIGIDGMCASGKTTLSAALEHLYDANVFHADDYFLPLEMRTESRLSEAGGNMHRERLEAEVLIPISKNLAVTASRFDCGRMTLLSPVSYPKKKINIVEGSYCLHPDLRKYYDLTVALKITPDRQLCRIKNRDPNSAEIFVSRWIPLENRYFEAFDIFGNADLVFNT